MRNFLASYGSCLTNTLVFLTAILILLLTTWAAFQVMPELEEEEDGTLELIPQIPVPSAQQENRLQLGPYYELVAEV